MSDVDGLLKRLRSIAACESCKRGVGRAMNAKDVLDIIATIEQQRAEIELWKTAAEEYIRQRDDAVVSAASGANPC